MPLGPLTDLMASHFHCSSRSLKTCSHFLTLALLAFHSFSYCSLEMPTCKFVFACASWLSRSSMCKAFRSMLAACSFSRRLSFSIHFCFSISSMRLYRCAASRGSLTSSVSNKLASPWTETSESVRRCIGERTGDREGDRVGDNGGTIDDKSGADGDCGRGSPYGGIMPVARSGLRANGFHGGDMPNLEGEGGSIWTACSFSRASLLMLWDESIVRRYALQ
jgi:hypothetical protein